MATDVKNKGGSKPWTTVEQRQWLASKISDYIASKTKGSTAAFWPAIYEEWFRTWPLEGPSNGDDISADEALKRKKAVRFFFWYLRKLRRNGA
jgi:hypothetical protein